MKFSGIMLIDRGILERQYFQKFILLRFLMDLMELLKMIMNDGSQHLNLMIFISLRSILRMQNQNLNVLITGSVGISIFCNF